MKVLEEGYGEVLKDTGFETSKKDEKCLYCFRKARSRVDQFFQTDRFFLLGKDGTFTFLKVSEVLFDK